MYRKIFKRIFLKKFLKAHFILFILMELTEFLHKKKKKSDK